MDAFSFFFFSFFFCRLAGLLFYIIWYEHCWNGIEVQEVQWERTKGYMVIEPRTGYKGLRELSAVSLSDGKCDVMSNGHGYLRLSINVPGNWDTAWIYSALRWVVRHSGMDGQPTALVCIGRWLAGGSALGLGNKFAFRPLVRRKFLAAPADVWPVSAWPGLPGACLSQRSYSELPPGKGLH